MICFLFIYFDNRSSRLLSRLASHCIRTDLYSVQVFVITSMLIGKVFFPFLHTPLSLSHFPHFIQHFPSFYDIVIKC